jgi:hypothetical protein
MRTLLAIMLFAGTSVFAETRSLPVLTQDALYGVWEAVVDDGSMATGVYRMEISRESPSYLVALIGPVPYCRFLAQLVDSEVKDGKVRLHFRTVLGAKPTRIYGEREFVIAGIGSGDNESGAIKGTLRSLKNDDYPEALEPVFFKRPAWTQDLDRISKGAEGIIAEQRRKPKT